MDGTTMVVMIVLVACLAGSFDNWVKHKNKAAKNQAQDQELESLRSDVVRLTERVRVLEKIATDEDTRLRQEISRLA